MEQSKDVWDEIPVYRLDLIRERTIPFKKIGGSEDAAQILHALLDKSPVEQFVVLYVNSDSTLVGAEKIAVGSLEKVHVTMRDIFRGAVTAAVPMIIMGHNHPNDDPTPSPQDLILTDRAIQAGALIGIEIYDHIVVSPSGKHISIHDFINQKYFDILAGYDLQQMPPDLRQKMADLMGLDLKAIGHPNPKIGTNLGDLILPKIKKMEGK